MKAEEYVELLNRSEKISLLSETAPEIERLGIKRYHHGNEALHGVVRPGRFTVFPQAIAMGASFHPELVEKIAEAISDEARARHNKNHGEMIGGDFDGLYNGLLTFWSPNLNTARDPRWGRTGETYGEDPYLAGILGVAFIKGLQGNREDCLKTVATPKHFVGNNEEDNRFECNAEIPRDQYFDYYLKPFEMAVKEGRCAGIMAAYNGVNGVPCHANHELLTEILRVKWGFEGYVVSDCGGVSHLVDRHRFAGTPQEAAAMALKAGVDLECGSCGTVLQVYKNYLEKACEEGLVTEAEIDSAVCRVLKARDRLGILEERESPYNHLSEEIIGCRKHQELALRMAEESLVLLKNENIDQTPILPVRTGAQICVIGNQADCSQFGDYSGTPINSSITILEGLRESYPEADIRYIPYEKPEIGESFQVLEQDFLAHYEGVNRKPGLEGSYESLKDGIGKRIDSCIDFEWENMAPDPMIQKENFQISWRGILVPKKSGNYQFVVKVNEKECGCKGRYRLMVDDRPAHLDTFELEARQEYSISLEYENTGKRPSVSLQWKQSGGTKTSPYQQEVEAAGQCDVVIACLGLGTEYEAEGRDKMDLNLPGEQMELLKAVSKVNSNLIVTLYNGSSLTIPWIQEHAKGILECWYPGEQGGRAIARVISGKVSPSGRLPLTFYKNQKDLPSFQCYDITKGFTHWYAKDVLYPFGYGLSYTGFQYAGLCMNHGSGELEGVVKLSNTGFMAGYEVVQVYARYMEREGEPNRLVFVKKVWLEPGEEIEVAFSIPGERFASYDMARGDAVIRDGGYLISVGQDAGRMVISEEKIRREKEWRR